MTGGRRVLEGREERGLVVLVGRVERLHRLLDVIRDRLDRRAAGRLAAVVPADAVGDHAERGEPLARQLEQLGVREAGRANAGRLVERGDEVVVLVVAAYEPRVRHSEEIELFVPG